MTRFELILLAVLFFVTSVVGVVTGSNSLITVPVMFQFGIDEKVAVATNMFGLTFMAIGATIPFVRQGSLEIRKLWPYVLLTIAGSGLGALLVGVITDQALKLVVSIAMIAIVIFSLVRPRMREIKPSRLTVLAFVLTFVLAIYGGLYSGGYVTVLTVVYVAFAGMTFTESVASTKFINVFSSGIATLVFIWQGLVDYSLGIVLAVAMFVGAYAGAHYATRINEIWMKRIFLTTVLFLAIKTLVDFF